MGISRRAKSEKRVPNGEHHKVITVSKQMESQGMAPENLNQLFSFLLMENCRCRANELI